MAKTVFMNPGKTRTRRRRKSGKKRRRVSRPATRHVRRRRTGRRRRRNAGIAPFVANPMIMSNPRRRSSGKRRRRNPEMKLKPILMNTGLAIAGSGAGAAVNLLGIRRVNNIWLRNGLRVALGAVSAGVFQNSFGGAAAGSVMYPMWAELALLSGVITEATNTEADLDEISADLEDVLNDGDPNDDDGGLFE